jgi:tetratricopeptide (TPR) repeat protein
VLPVADVWGDAWLHFGSATPFEAPPPEIPAAFRKSADYEKTVAGQLPPQPPAVDAVPLPDSPYDLVLVTLSHADPLGGVPMQKVFVTARNGGKTDLALTAALEAELRREHAAVCGTGASISLTNVEIGVRVSAEDAGDWGGSCATLIRWMRKEKQLVVESHQVDLLIEEHQRARIGRQHREAKRLLQAGNTAAAIEKWDELSGQLRDDGEGAEICRAIAYAWSRAGNHEKTRTQLELCAAFATNRGESLLRLADELRTQGQTIAALARYEQALEAPLGEADRLAARRTATDLELELAEAALRDGKKELARLRYERLLDTPLSGSRAQRVHAQLRALR